MDLVFFGTPDFSSKILRKISAVHRVKLAVTRPDRPAGRHRKVEPPPVKKACLALGIECFQPEDLKDPRTIDRIKGAGGEAGIVVSYGGLLPKKLLEILPRGFINLHPSLLPRYRGAAPINWAIINGESKTGLTTFLIDERMDAGSILMQEELDILTDETAGELLMRVAEPGAVLLLETLSAMAEGRQILTPQEESLATYAPMLKKEDGRIDWQKPAREIVDLIRGVNPWPGAYCFFDGKLIKIHRAIPTGDSGDRPGKILRADRRKGLVVASGAGSVSIIVIQKEGGRPQDHASFLSGAHWEPGQYLT